MQDSLNKDEIIEKIARRLRCSTCGRRYKPYDFTVMEEREDIAVMKMVCRECHKQSVVFAVIQRRRVRPVYSELQPDEWQRFRDQRPLSNDDMIDFHRSLNEYDGDLSDILEDPLPPEALEEDR